MEIFIPSELNNWEEQEIAKIEQQMIYHKNEYLRLKALLDYKLGKSERVKARQREYIAKKRQDPEYRLKEKERSKAYRLRPGQKEKHREYMKKYREKQRERKESYVTE